MNPLSADALAGVSEVRRQLRDVTGLREQRPGVFVAEGNTLVEMFEDQGAPVARLNASAHGKAEIFALDDPLKRRALIDGVKRAVRRLAED